MRALIDKVLLNPLVLLSLGLMCTILGALSVASLPATRSRLSHVEQLRPVGVAEPNQAAFVEGRISNHTPTVYRQFVAYLREEINQLGVSRSSRWVEVARETPPLVIEADGRVARVVNRNYSLETTDVTVGEQPQTVTKRGVRFRGFTVGSPVLAVGSVGEEKEELVAEFLYAGTHAEYVADLHRHLTGASWDGWFLLGGIGCISLGLWRLRRFLREPITRAQPDERTRRSSSSQSSPNKRKKRRSNK